MAVGFTVLMAALALNDSALVFILLLYRLIMNLPRIVLIMNNLGKAKV